MSDLSELLHHKITPAQFLGRGAAYLSARQETAEVLDAAKFAASSAADRLIQGIEKSVLDYVAVHAPLLPKSVAKVVADQVAASLHAAIHVAIG